MTLDHKCGQMTEAEYLQMKEDVAVYGTGEILDHTAREDRAFLVHEVNEYEIIHDVPVEQRTFPKPFVDAEMAWWATI